jgi:hypothetical protein
MLFNNMIKRLLDRIRYFKPYRIRHTTMTLDQLISHISASTDPFNQRWRRAFKHKRFTYTADLLDKITAAREQQAAGLLEVVLAIASEDGVDQRFTPLLLPLLAETWHHSTEDIVMLLEEIRDPASVNLLHRTALAIPDYDDGRSLAKKCIWTLGAINTAEARAKLALLQQVTDPIIREAATTELQSKKRASHNL